MPVDKVRPITHSFKEKDGHYKNCRVGTAFFHPDRVSLLINPGVALMQAPDSFCTIWMEDREKKGE